MASVRFWKRVRDGRKWIEILFTPYYTHYHLQLIIVNFEDRCSRLEAAVKVGG